VWPLPSYGKRFRPHFSLLPQTDVRDLIYDAVIGRQMIEATLEEQVQSCANEFGDCYRTVLETLRDSASAHAVDSRSSDNEEHKIAAMIEAAGGSECSDEMLRIEIAERFRQAFTECREDLTQYEQEFVSAASAVDASGSVEAAAAKCGGWSELDEERFRKVLRSFEGKHGIGKKPQLLYDQVALVLPSVPKPEIKRHVKFHQHLRFHHQKCKDRKRELQRKLGELQEEASTKFQTSAEQAQERLRQMQQLSAMRQQCEQLQGQVSQWRVTKEAKERVERQQQELEELIASQKQQEQELRSRRKHEQQKLGVEEFKCVRLAIPRCCCGA
jgi:AcrR family transcriptional regulator